MDTSVYTYGACSDRIYIFLTLILLMLVIKLVAVYLIWRRMNCFEEQFYRVEHCVYDLRDHLGDQNHG